MIHVQVSPAGPLLLGQMSKNGMCLKLKIAAGGREAFDESQQLRDILLKIHRTSASLSILIHFGCGLNSLWPLQRSPKRDPFDHRLIDQVGFESRRLFADGNSERVAQVTDHLV